MSDTTTPRTLPPALDDPTSPAPPYLATKPVEGDVSAGGAPPPRGGANGAPTMMATPSPSPSQAPVSMPQAPSAAYAAPAAPPLPSSQPFYAAPQPMAVLVAPADPLTLTDRPDIVHCTRCGYTGPSDLRLIPTGKTYCASLVTCLIFWPLLWVPFCIPQCNAVEHDCPRCRSPLVTVKAGHPNVVHQAAA